MSYDLPNYIVKVNGGDRKIDFNILSEAMEGGRRVLQLAGFDEMGNVYDASGWYDKKTYLLNVGRLQQRPATPTVPPEDLNSYLVIDGTGTLLINSIDKFLL